MNKRYLVTWAVMFVVWMAGSFMVHAVLLTEDYQALPALFRTEADSQRHFPLMLLAHVMLAGAFTWIYAQGVDARPWLAQGLRFGVAVACLAIVPTYLIYYVVQPMPLATVIKQIVFDGVLMLVLGAVVAFLYRQRTSA